MSKLYVLFVVVMAALTSACAPVLVSKEQAFPEVYKEMPASVLVIPAMNKSTAAEAPEYFSSTIAEPIANAGYYVLPIEITTALLRQEGVQEGEQIKDVPPQLFRDLFGADAILFVTINEWDTNYYVLGGNVTVGIEYDMKSTKTGQSLWYYRDNLVVDTSDNSNSGNLIASIIATAIKTAMQDYVPIAQRVNAMALSTVPFGRYHPSVGQDGRAQVVSPAKISRD